MKADFQSLKNLKELSDIVTKCFVTYSFSSFSLSVISSKEIKLILNRDNVRTMGCVRQVWCGGMEIASFQNFLLCRASVCPQTVQTEDPRHTSEAP